MTRPHRRSLIISGVVLLMVSVNFVVAVIGGIRNADLITAGLQGIWLIPATWWYVHSLRRYRQSNVRPIKPHRGFVDWGRVTHDVSPDMDPKNFT